MKQTPPCPASSVLEAIGNTPVVRLNHVVPHGCADVYVKLEFFNPTGSYKDRMAKSMIECAESSGALRPGMTVVEASGGSTGSSLALVCAAKGYGFQVISSNAFAKEKLKTVAAFGGAVELIHSPTGKITEDLCPKMITRAEETAQEDQVYWTDQFTNTDAFIGYGSLGEELVQQFPSGIHGFCGAVGTAGMVMGVAKILKPAFEDIKVVVLEPATSPAISAGRSGAHGIEGVGIGDVPALLDKQLYDEAWPVEETEAKAMCRALAVQEGLLVGASTGMNVVAAIKLARELGPGKTVVTVACDTGLKYLHGDLFSNI